MEIHGPRQIAGGPNKGKWHYTLGTDEPVSGPYPIGHCANGCPGHDTEDGAIQHYREYLADGAVFFKQDLPKCDVPGCQGVQEHQAICPGGWNVMSLCTAHANRDGVLLALAR